GSGRETPLRRCCEETPNRTISRHEHGRVFGREPGSVWRRACFKVARSFRLARVQRVEPRIRLLGSRRQRPSATSSPLYPPTSRSVRRIAMRSLAAVAVAVADQLPAAAPCFLVVARS